MSKIQLRGGHTTSDPRLDRLPTWDDRSDNWPIMAALEPHQQKPRSYTWRVPIRRDQGQEGRCVEFGIIHELGARPATVSEGKIDNIIAAHGIYWPAQLRDEWPGGSYPGATPQYEGTSVHAGMSVATELGYYKEYRWAFDIDEFILGIGHKGPGIVGVNWYNDMFRPDDEGYVTPTGGFAGGHCFCVPQVDLKRERFGCVQSWGLDWGVLDPYHIGGYFYIKFDDMDKLLREEGEFCIPMGRRL